MKHELKILPQYFEAVVAGIKTFEYRKNDRGFQKGDTVILLEFDPERGLIDEDCYTGRKKKFEIGYVLQLDSGFCVFSLLDIK